MGAIAAHVIFRASHRCSIRAGRAAQAVESSIYAKRRARGAGFAVFGVTLATALTLAAGWCKATFAGALGMQLGGKLSYAGRVEHRPELGSGPAPGLADIARALRLSRAVTVAATALAGSLALTPTLRS